MGIGKHIKEHAILGSPVVPVGMVAHEWDGTRLRIQDENGTWGPWVDLSGQPGVNGAPGEQGPQGPSGEPGIPGSGIISSHSALDDLLNDDHPQYLTEERGDARYVKSGEVTNGTTDHGSLSGLLDNDHPQYALSGHVHTGTYASADQGVTNGNSHDHNGGDGAQIDHGGLAGLSDDDHPQYDRWFVRQTVLTGQNTGASNKANFLSAAAGTAVTVSASATYPLVMTWSNGFSSPYDYFSTLTSDQSSAFSSLTARSNPFLYVENNGAGSLTYGHSIYVPQYGVGFDAVKANALLATFEGTDGASLATYTDLYGNAGTVTGTVTASNTVKFWGANTSARLGSAESCIDFDAPDFSRPFTLEVAFRTTGHAAVQTIIWGGTTQYSFGIHVNTSQKLVMNLSSNGSSQNLLNAVADTVTTIADNTWYYLCFQWDGGIFRTFIKDTSGTSVEVYAFAAASTTPLFQPNKIRLGARYDATLGLFTAGTYGYIGGFRFKPAALYTSAPSVITSAPSVEELHFFDIYKMIMYKGQPGSWTATKRLFLGECTVSSVSDGLYSFPDQVKQGTTAARVQYSGFSYIVGSTIYGAASSAAAGVTLTATTVPQNKYGCFGWQIDSAGTVSSKDAPNNATGYNSAADAINDLPSADANKVIFMYITVIRSDAAFVGNTTSLSLATVTTAYYGYPGNTKFSLVADEVSAVVTYAIRGIVKMTPAALTVAAGTGNKYSFNHNIGTDLIIGIHRLVNINSNNGWVVGDIMDGICENGTISLFSASAVGADGWNRLSIWHEQGSYTTRYASLVNGNAVGITITDWKYFFEARRAF